MPKKTITLDGKNFSDLESFYNEADKVLTRDLGWDTGHNMDAFNDLLRGGFGVYEYGEPIRIVWANSGKSKTDLGYAATIRYLEEKMATCHPDNMPLVKVQLEKAKNHSGPALFDLLTEIIGAHKHIELTLE